MDLGPAKTYRYRSLVFIPTCILGRITLLTTNQSYFSEVGASPNPCSDTYPGPGAFSEPEVRTVADFVSRNNVVLYMAFHNCGQFYLTPYGYTFDEAPDFAELVGLFSGLFIVFFRLPSNFRKRSV